MSKAVRREEDLQGVDDSRNVTQNREEDVDQEIRVAAALKEDTERRKEDGKNDLADIAVITFRSARAHTLFQDDYCMLKRRAHRNHSSGIHWVLQGW